MLNRTLSIRANSRSAYALNQGGSLRTMPCFKEKDLLFIFVYPMFQFKVLATVKEVYYANELGTVFPKLNLT